MGIGRATHAINTRFEELVEHVIFIGGDKQLVDGQTHHAGHMTGTHVAKIATGYAEANLLLIVLRGLKITRKVIHHLRQ